MRTGPYTAPHESSIYLFAPILKWGYWIKINGYRNGTKWFGKPTFQEFESELRTYFKGTGDPFMAG
ncbi:hypothetical protein TI05_02695 [Achromatium sp. WMS3]|nr:hypothetical protein TI05_02695 [Achromatium sp. WMS3]